MDVHDDIRQLLAAARRGESDAIGRIFEAARGRLMLLAHREFPADIRAKVGPSDVIQETALDMHRDFSRFVGTTAEECFAWLREILRHNMVDAVRRYRTSMKRRSTREVSLSHAERRQADAFMAAGRPPDGSAIRREEAAVLGDVLARLPDEYQRVLRLRYWGGMAFVDMAPLLGRSPEAVRKLWFRAVERLHVELEAAARSTRAGPADASGS
jgi:RNA polymerase sigma-70 factor (ECF subfamily)